MDSNNIIDIDIKVSSDFNQSSIIQSSQLDILESNQKRKVDDLIDEIKPEIKIQRKIKDKLSFIFDKCKLPFEDNDTFLVDLSFDLYSQPYSTQMIAEYFMKLHKDKYVYFKKNNYFYNGIFWEKDCEFNYELMFFFGEIFKNELLKYVFLKMEKFKSELGYGNDDSVKDNIKKAYQLLQKVKKLDFIDKIKNHIPPIVIMCTNDEIEFDSNPYLIAFRNGVYDLQRREFVEPKYDFYISKTTNYDYVKSTENQLMILDNFISTIFPNEVNKTDYMMFLSTGLCGLRIKSFYMAFGTGCNGKSTLNALMIKCVGDYGYLLPCDFLLDDIELSGNSQPLICGLHNVRFAVCHYTERKWKLSLLKEMTDPENNLDPNIKIKLRASTVFECNSLPILYPCAKNIVKERLRISKFDTEFYDKDRYNFLEFSKKDEMNLPHYKWDEFREEFKCVLFDYLVPYLAKFFENGNEFYDMPSDCAEKVKLCI